MKHKTELVINAPWDRVWSIFDDPDYISKWQPNLIALLHESGEPGQPGAVSKLTYDENGRQVVLTETIAERRPPDLFAGTYDSRYGTTTVVNRFEMIDAQTTRWTVWSRYRFRGVMKLMALFMASSIRRRTCADLERFKQLGETEAATQ